LLGLTFWGLWSNRRVEQRPDAIMAFPEPVKLRNYLTLFALPLVACAVYFVALVSGLRWSTNLVFYYVATPLGALAWLLSVALCVRRAGHTVAAGIAAVKG
jgi:hypothetical protein